MTDGRKTDEITVGRSNSPFIIRYRSLHPLSDLAFDAVLSYLQNLGKQMRNEQTIKKVNVNVCCNLVQINFPYNFNLCVKVYINLQSYFSDK